MHPVLKLRDITVLKNGNVPMVPVLLPPIQLQAMMNRLPSQTICTFAKVLELHGN